MCFTSAVMDQWSPYIPYPTTPWSPPATSPPYYPQGPTTPIIPYNPPPTPQVAPGVDNEKLQKLLETFRKAYEAAEEFDELTGQPDCVDPEKAKLIERVEELERRLAALEESNE